MYDRRIHSVFSMFRTGLFVVGILGPFVIWAGACVAVKQEISKPDSLLRALRVGRWIAWLGAILLWLSFIKQPHWWVYAGCATTFSIGLSFPEQWLKKHFHAEV